MNLNKVLLIGRVTRDPEAKATDGGIKITKFGLATNHYRKDKEGNKQEDVEFHNLVSFGQQAETIEQYVKKGQLLHVEGRLNTSSWESDGKKMYRTEIIAEKFQFGPKAGEQTEAPKTDSYNPDAINPENIPF